MRHLFVFVTLLCTVTLLVYTYMNVNSPFVMMTQAHEATVNKIKNGNGKRDLLVIGILSHTNNACIRDAQRKTLIPKAKAYKWKSGCSLS